MNCVEWEQRIALYAGGDLAPEDARAAERHMAECAGCQMMLSGLRESLSLAREAHHEPVEAAHFAAVRARVLSQIEQDRARGWRFSWIYAAAGAAAVLLVTLWPRPEQRLLLPMPTAPAAPAIERVIGQPRRKRAAKSWEAQPTETVLMKIETNNPDVVLYWIAETKGDTK